MSDKKISELTASTTPLAGTEVLPIVQSGITKKTSVESVLTSVQPSGTANGVLYLNGFKVASSGSELVFNGSNLGIGAALPVHRLDIIQDQNANTWSRVRNNNSGSNAYAGVAVNAFGNSWGMRIGSQAANSNALQFVIDMTSPAVRAELNSAGDFKLTTGNLVIGTAGKGIDFSADGQAAGMTSELLDDYEEGLWSPVLVAGTSGTITLNSSYDTASYVKVGSLVTVQMLVIVSSVDSPTGTLKIALPIAISSLGEGRSYGSVSLSVNSTVSVNASDFNAYIEPSESTITFRTGAGTTVNSDVADEVKAGTSFILTATYRAA